MFETKKGSAVDVETASTQRNAVLEMIRTKGQVSRKEIESAFNISRSSAGRLLDILGRDKLIKQFGRHKDAYYTAADKK